jgi:hypothetical protein
MEIAIGIAIIIIALFLISHHNQRQRRAKKRASLMAKYNSQDVVDAIMDGKIWQGMSAAQLVESWGTPADSDVKVYKTKTTQIYKYNQTGKNRYGSRVRVENDVVVGWEQK